MVFCFPGIHCDIFQKEKIDRENESAMMNVQQRNKVKFKLNINEVIKEKVDNGNVELILINIL